jgi:CRISPR-associated protein Cmx8
LGKTRIPDALHAVELYQVEKKGNNVRQLVAERLLPERRVLDAYERIRGDRRKHPLFKRLQIGNLVRGEPWHRGAEQLFERFPTSLFIHGEHTPPGRFFGTDVRHRFQQVIQDQGGTPMQTQDDDVLQRLIYQLVRTYVDQRARERAALGDKRFDTMSEAEQRKYREARSKVANTAFLSLRGRREADVSEYFTGTLCAVGHFLKEEDFLLLGDTLMRSPDTIKTLTMLALSAHSWSAREKTDDASGDTSAAHT